MVPWSAEVRGKMSDIASAARRERAAGWLSWPVLGVGLLAFCGLLLQSTTHLNHDLSWILESGARMLHGAEFGRDIIAANPPLAWFLALPPAGIADLFGLDPVLTFRLYTATTLAFCLGFVWWSRSKLEAGKGGGAILLLATGYAVFIGCYRDFGQREHLAFAYSLPYVLLAAGRLEGHRFSPGIAIAAGLAAGLGFALKPYFLAVPLLVELMVVLWRRSLRCVFRSEVWALAGVIAGYLLVVFIVTPSYVFEVVPAVRPIYWGFNNDLPTLLSKISIEIIGFLLALGMTLFRKGPGRALQWCLIAAAAGFLLAFLVQMKGYSYHGLPFRSLVLISLALHLQQAIADPCGRGPAARFGLVFLAGAVFLAVLGDNARTLTKWYHEANLENGSLAARIDQIINLVEGHAAGQRFLALSTHPFPGFPTASYTSAVWASRTNSAFFIPAVAKLRAAADPGQTQLLRFAEDKARTFLLHDLAAEPQIILVDARTSRHALRGLSFDILAFYLEDPRTREIWAGYEEIEPVQGFRVFLRRDRQVDE